MGFPVSRNNVNTQPQPRLSNWTSSTNGPTKLSGGPTVIEEPFKKVKKPAPQSQALSRSTTPTPSNNGISRADDEKKQGGEGRGMAASTSFKSLSDSSSADTTDSKVQQPVEIHMKLATLYRSRRTSQTTKAYSLENTVLLLFKL